MLHVPTINTCHTVFVCSQPALPLLLLYEQVTAMWYCTVCKMFVSLAGEHLFLHM